MEQNPTNAGHLDCDLAIVGGSIAGPALADDGYRIVLIERRAEPLDTARGDHLQPITCEWLKRWGVLDAMWARGAERMRNALSGIATSPDKLHRYCMNAAGY